MKWPKRKVEASISTADIERAFYDDFAQGDRYWWWCRLVMLDPNELIVDDGEGDLYRLPFEVSGLDVAFGDATPVRIEFVDASIKSEAVAVACNAIASVRGEKVAASYSSRDESRRNYQQGGQVDLTTLRATLGLAADVPEAEVLRLANERLAAEADPDPEGEPSGEPEGDPEGEPQPEGEPEGEGEPQAQSAVLVDATALTKLQADAALGRKAHERQIDDENKRILDAAIAKGKFPPAARAGYEALLKNEVTRQATVEQIDALAENVIPVEEVGEARESESEAAYPEHLFPEVIAKKARIAAGASSRVMREDG